MSGLSMNDDGEVVLPKFVGPIPYLFNKGTCGVVLFNFNPPVQQSMFNFNGSSKGRYNDDVFRMYCVQWQQLRSVCIHDELNATVKQVLIHFLVMDHLAQEVHVLARVLLKGFVTFFNSVLNTITKTKMPGQKELHRAEIKQCR